MIRKKPSLSPDPRREFEPAGSVTREGKPVQPSQDGTTPPSRQPSIRRPVFTGSQERENFGKRADELFTKIAQVKVKTDFLLGLIEQSENVKHYIPVALEATEVRQAVLRRDKENSPDGSRVYWGMFKAAIDKAMEENLNVSIDLLTNLTGDDQTDHNILNNNYLLYNEAIFGQNNDLRFSYHFDGSSGSPFRFPNPDESKLNLLARLLLYAGAFSLQYILSKQLDTWQARRRAEMDATKMPNGSEVPIMLGQILIGLATFALINGFFKDKTKKTLKDALSPGYPGIDIDGLVDKAEILVNGGSVDGQTLQDMFDGGAFQDSTTLLQYAQARIGQGDFEIIREYCLNWLNTHITEPGYEEWHCYLDLSRSSYHMANQLKVSPIYSPKFRGQAIKTGYVASQKPAIVSHTDGLYYDNSIGALYDFPNTYTVDYGKLSPEEQDAWLNIDINLMDYLEFSVEGHNDMADRWAQVMAFNPWVKRLVCCFANFSGSLDLETLRSLRGLVEILAKGVNFNWGKMLNDIWRQLSGDLKEALYYEIIAMINQLFDQTIDRIMKIVNHKEFSGILICFPVEILFNALFSVLEELREYIKNIFTKLFNQSNKEFSIYDHKIGLIAESKFLRMLLSMLDAIIYALETGINCEYKDVTIQQLVTEIVVQPGPPVIINNLDPNLLDGNYNELIDPVQINTDTDNSNIYPYLIDPDIFGQTLDLDKTKNKYNSFGFTKAFKTKLGVEVPTLGDILQTKTEDAVAAPEDVFKDCLGLIQSGTFKAFTRAGSSGAET